MATAAAAAGGARLLADSRLQQRRLAGAPLARAISSGNASELLLQQQQQQRRRRRSIERLGSAQSQSQSQLAQLQQQAARLRSQASKPPVAQSSYSSQDLKQIDAHITASMRKLRHEFKLELNSAVEALAKLVLERNQLASGGGGSELGAPKQASKSPHGNELAAQSICSLDSSNSSSANARFRRQLAPSSQEATASATSASLRRRKQLASSGAVSEPAGSASTPQAVVVSVRSCDEPLVRSISSVSLKNAKGSSSKNSVQASPPIASSRVDCSSSLDDEAEQVPQGQTRQLVVALKSCGQSFTATDLQQTQNCIALLGRPTSHCSEVAAASALETTSQRRSDKQQMLVVNSDNDSGRSSSSMNSSGLAVNNNNNEPSTGDGGSAPADCQSSRQAAGRPAKLFVTTTTGAKSNGRQQEPGSYTIDICDERYPAA